MTTDPAFEMMAEASFDATVLAVSPWPQLTVAVKVNGFVLELLLIVALAVPLSKARQPPACVPEADKK